MALKFHELYAAEKYFHVKVLDDVWLTTRKICKI